MPGNHIRAAEFADEAGAVRPATAGCVDPTVAGQGGVDLHALREAVRSEIRELLRSLDLVKRDAPHPDVAGVLAAIFGSDEAHAAAVLAPLRAAMEE
jgi:hypothetical protein